MPNERKSDILPAQFAGINFVNNSILEIKKYCPILSTEGKTFCTYFFLKKYEIAAASATNPHLRKG